MFKQLVAITLSVPMVVTAQKIDTVYYDSRFKKCSKDVALFLGYKQLDKNLCGYETYYYLTGEKRATVPYKNGSRNGKAMTWYKNGQKLDEGNYVMGIKDSVWVHWYASGIKADEAIYKKGKRTSLNHWDENGNRVYLPEQLDHKPFFDKTNSESKSLQACSKFLTMHIVYPEEARTNKIEGKVMVGFTVDEKGNTTNVAVLEPLNDYLDSEAVRIVSLFPIWTPAKVKSMNVRSQLKLPIYFKLKR